MEWKRHLIHMAKALLVSVLLAGILLVAMAFILYKTSFTGIVEHVMVVLIYLIPCLVGGFLLGKQEEKRKFLWGAGFGVVFFLLLILVAALAPGMEGSIDWSGRLRVLMICALGGMAGGMLS